MTLSYDPEYYTATAEFFAARAGPQPAVHDVAARRKNITAMFEALFEKLPLVTDVEHSVFEVKSYDGHPIKLHRFFKKSSTPPVAGPAILHAHGGGTIQGSVALFAKPLLIQVQQTGVQVFSVDYRLAPENPHPTPVEDCYAGLTWLYEHADEFAVDRNRIATMGQSAGGLLAAGITLMARDRKLTPPIAKQILNYPMLDDRNLTPSPALEPFAVWSYTDNITAWTALLGDAIGKDHALQYAAPARAVSVQGLPTTYIDVGELDIFRDEDIAYAARISAANISVELHVYPGLPHAFEDFAPNIDATKRAMAARFRAIQML